MVIACSSLLRKTQTGSRSESWNRLTCKRGFDISSVVSVTNHSVVRVERFQPGQQKKKLFRKISNIVDVRPEELTGSASQSTDDLTVK